jgi:hypothetical protein
MNALNGSTLGTTLATTYGHDAVGGLILRFDWKLGTVMPRLDHRAIFGRHLHTPQNSARPVFIARQQIFTAEPALIWEIKHAQIF